MNEYLDISLINIETLINKIWLKIKHFVTQHQKFFEHKLGSHLKCKIFSYFVIFNTFSFLSQVLIFIRQNV